MERAHSNIQRKFIRIKVRPQKLTLDPRSKIRFI